MPARKLDSAARELASRHGLTVRHAATLILEDLATEGENTAPRFGRKAVKSARATAAAAARAIPDAALLALADSPPGVDLVVVPPVASEPSTVEKVIDLMAALRATRRRKDRP